MSYQDNPMEFARKVNPKELVRTQAGFVEGAAILCVCGSANYGKQIPEVVVYDEDGNPCLLVPYDRLGSVVGKHDA